jgi:predicted outer membrane repeat protein
MRGKLAARAASGLTAGVLAVAGLCPTQDAQAASAAVRVPCSAAALASTITAAPAGQTLSLAAHCLYQLAAPLPVVTQNLTIDGHDATLARSSALGTPAFTILSAAGATLAVSRLNFTNGDNAISVTQDGSLIVQGGVFTGNHATLGGAINIDTEEGSLSVSGATFTRNSATDSGGAIDADVWEASATLTGDRFDGNTAGDDGGALLDYTTNGAQVTGSTFDANQAADGGAIAVLTLNQEILKDVTLQDNRATDDGGGIYSVLGLVASGLRIRDNHAGSDGGGIYQAGAGTWLTDIRVQGNTAQIGGGIYNGGSGLELAAGTVTGNRASADGGGIYNAGDAMVDTTTISGNRAGADGGGLYNTVGDVTATGSAIIRNTAAAGGGIYDGPGPDNVTLTATPVQNNHPDNCEPLATIVGCTA